MRGFRNVGIRDIDCQIQSSHGLTSMRNRNDRWGSRRKLTFYVGRDGLFRYFLPWSADSRSGQTDRQTESSFLLCAKHIAAVTTAFRHWMMNITKQPDDSVTVLLIERTFAGLIDRLSARVVQLALLLCILFPCLLSLTRICLYAPFLLSTRSPIRRQNSRWLQINGSSHRVSASTNICEQRRGSTFIPLFECRSRRINDH